MFIIWVHLLKLAGGLSSYKNYEVLGWKINIKIEFVFYFIDFSLIFNISTTIHI